jgi:hypothetical protein
MDKNLMETKEKLTKELTDLIKKRDITVGDLDVIYKSVKTIYYLTTIEARGDYSQDSMENYRGSYRGSYDGRAGRDGDSDGRYSEGNYRSMKAYDNYGYSGHDSKEHLIREMRNMMQDLEPRAKQAVQECINRMEG